MICKPFRGAAVLMMALFFFIDPSLKTAFSTQIVAIVGDSVITDYEVSQRARIMALLHNMNTKDQDLIKKLEREIVSFLIDEQMKKDYAKRMQIEISKNVIDGIILEYAKKTGKGNVESLKRHVLSNGIDWEIFEEAITNEIVWSNIVYGGIAKQIQVTEAEIEQRASMQNLDPTNIEVLNKIKQEIVNERLYIYIGKIISQMKRFNIVESVN